MSRTGLFLRSRLTSLERQKKRGAGGQGKHYQLETLFMTELSRCYSNSIKYAAFVWTMKYYLGLVAEKRFIYDKGQKA